MREKRPVTPLGRPGLSLQPAYWSSCPGDCLCWPAACLLNNYRDPATEGAAGPSEIASLTIRRRALSSGDAEHRERANPSIFRPSRRPARFTGPGRHKKSFDSFCAGKAELSN